MTTEPVKLWDIYEGLKNNFLFKSDINSIYILLALYDIEENIKNIRPKYTCTKDIKRKVKNALKNRHDREILAHNISLLIHEDINRLELCFYLEGYKYGYYHNRWINMLEKKALETIGLDRIYGDDFLFHFNFPNEEIINIYRKINREIDAKEKHDRYLEGLIYTFSNKVIKEKLYNLDNYIYKQLKLDFTPYNYSITEEAYILKTEEINIVYQLVIKILAKNLTRTFKDACWYALNDKVKARYK